MGSATESLSGLVVRVAPRFHVARGIAPRLGSRDALAPNAVFRPLEPDELAAIAPPRDGPLRTDEIALLRLPDHLRASWWRLVERTSAAAPLSGFDELAAALLELLRFKDLPLPARCRCEVVLTSGDRRSPALGTSSTASAALAASAPRDVADLSAAPDGSADTDEDAPERSAVLRLVANLGDEPAQVVVLSTLAVRLEPGDGLWLPDRADLAIEAAGATSGTIAEPACLLTLWADG